LEGWVVEVEDVGVWKGREEVIGERRLIHMKLRVQKRSCGVFLWSVFGLGCTVQYK
jgi:hypothetical protein